MSSVPVDSLTINIVYAFLYAIGNIKHLEYHSGIQHNELHQAVFE